MFIINITRENKIKESGIYAKIMCRQSKQLDVLCLTNAELANVYIESCAITLSLGGRVMDFKILAMCYVCSVLIYTQCTARQYGFH